MLVAAPQKLVRCIFGVKGTEIEKDQGLAHREGRTRSLQITHHKSLTLYPIELGGQSQMNKFRSIRHVSNPHTAFI